MIQIREVTTNSQLSDFIKFADSLYVGNPYRVTPLHTFEKNILSRKKNPAFDYCESCYWLAYRNGKIVGRIAGIISHKANKTWNYRNARFGWFDFIDDYEVSESLLHTAEAWARSKGMTGIQGPLGFTDMDMEGMLVDGFNEVGTLAVLYNHPYYPIHIERYGYKKEADWVQKEFRVPTEMPERYAKMAKIVQERYNVHPLRVKSAKELIPYAKSMFKTLNASFKSLYGFVELSDKQIEHYTKEYFSIIVPDYVCMVLDSKNEVIGFGVSMPSLSQALIKSKGNLIPFGALNIYSALRKPKIVDMYLNGVRPDYQGKGIHAIYYYELLKAYIEHGIEYAITNPQLEDNNKALALWDDFEHRQHLRRRSYFKAI